MTSGQPFSVKVRIKNVGTSNAGSFRTRLYLDGSYWSRYADNTNLNVGLTTTWVWNNCYISSTGSHTIKAYVDADYDITESSESNNDRSESISINKAKWTVLGYFDGDNNLEGSLIHDFEDIASVGSSSSISIVLQMDRISGYSTDYGDWTDCQRFFVTNGMDPTTDNSLQDMNEVNMGSGTTLTSFLTWGASRFVADYYMVILRDHGGGWTGSCSDDTSGGDNLDLKEIKDAFSSMESTIGDEIDLVFFHSCLMGQIEVASQIYSHVDYMVSSETVSYSVVSFPYYDSWFLTDGLIEYLVSNPSTSPYNYAVKIIELANPYDSSSTVTQSVAAYDLSKTSNLLSSMNTLSTYLKNNIYMYRDDISDARDNSDWYEGPYAANTERMIDLYQLASNIKTFVPNTNIQNAAQDVMNKIGPSGGSSGYFVIKERHTSSTSFCHGVGIYFPNIQSSYRTTYTTNNDFTSNTQWDEFLTYYYDTTAPSSVDISINDDLLYTTSSIVDLDITAFDGGSGLKDMSFDNEATGWSTWYTYSTTKSWTLSSGDGTKTVFLKVRDKAGNVAGDSSPWIYSWIILDTTAPSNPNDYSSDPSTNSWTNDNTVYVEWSGASDSTSNVYGYGLFWSTNPTSIPSASVDTTNEYTTSSPLSDGTWYLHIRTRDKAGNWNSGAYHIGPFKIDTSNPPSPSPNDGVSGWTNDNTPAFSWSEPSDMSDIAGYFWKVDSGSESWTTSTSITLSSQSDGTHTFYVRAEDNAGNTGSYGSHIFYIDTQNPPAPTPDDGVPSWTNDDTPTFSWNKPSDTSDISGYYWKIDSGSDSWITSASVTLSSQSDGTHVFYVKAKDNAGNVGNYGSHTFYIDTVAPSNPDENSTNPAIGVWTTDNTVYVEWTGASDDRSDVNGYGIWWRTTAPGNPSETLDTTNSDLTSEELSDGTWYLSIKAVDNAGNWNSGFYSVGPFNIDTTDPITPLPDDGIDDWGNDSTPTFTWTNISNDVDCYLWKVDSGAETQSEASSVTLSSKTDGTYTFHLKAVDFAGNEGDWESHIFKIDTVSPSGLTNLISTSHTKEEWSKDQTIDMAWSAATDSTSGLEGYGTCWTKTNDSTPTTNNIGDVTTITSPALEESMNWYFHIRPIDEAGNWGDTSHYGPFWVDNTPPVTQTIFENGTLCNGWFRNPVNITLSPTDNASGVDFTRYKVDSGIWQTYLSKTIFSEEGTHTIYYYSVDNVSNVETTKTFIV